MIWASVVDTNVQQTGAKVQKQKSKQHEREIVQQKEGTANMK